jgi:hypothetical protein
MRPTTIVDALDQAALLAATGWHVEARGACRDDVCVPLTEDATADVDALATALGVGVAHDEARGLWAIGPDARAHTIADPTLPDLTLRSRQGSDVALRSLVGRRGVLVAWASW